MNCGLAFGQNQFCDQDEKCYLSLGLINLEVSSFAKTQRNSQNTPHFLSLKNRQERLVHFTEPTFKRIPVCKPQEFLLCLNQKHQVDCFLLSILREFDQSTLPLEKHMIGCILIFKKFVIPLSFLWSNPVSTVGENREITLKRELLTFFLSNIFPLD